MNTGKAQLNDEMTRKGYSSAARHSFVSSVFFAEHSSPGETAPDQRLLLALYHAPFSPFLQNNVQSSRCRKENWDKHHTQSSGLMFLLPLIFFFSKMTPSLPWEEPNLCCERTFCRCGCDHYWHDGRMLRVGFCTTKSLWWKRNKEVKKDKSGPFVWIMWDLINTKLSWRRNDKPIYL